MPLQALRSRRLPFGIVKFTLVLLGSALAVHPAQGSDPEQERHAAFQAYEQGKMVDAMPLLEALSAKYPSDILVKERWAFATLVYSATLTDADQRKKTRVRARNIALDAQKLGDNSPLLQNALDVPEDGSEPLFSSRPEVDAAM